MVHSSPVLFWHDDSLLSELVATLSITPLVTASRDGVVAPKTVKGFDAIDYLDIGRSFVGCAELLMKKLTNKWHARSSSVELRTRLGKIKGGTHPYVCW